MVRNVPGKLRVGACGFAGGVFLLRLKSLRDRFTAAEVLADPPRAAQMREGGMS